MNKIYCGDCRNYIEYGGDGQHDDICKIKWYQSGYQLSSRRKVHAECRLANPNYDCSDFETALNTPFLERVLKRFYIY